MPLTSAPSDAAGGVRVWHYDGASAIRHEAELIAQDDHFYLIKGEAAAEPQAFADLVPGDARGGLPVFTLKRHPGWRIGLLSPPPAELAARLPRGGRYGGLIDQVGLWPAVAIMAAIAAGIVYAVLQSPPLVARLVPRSVERQLGQAMIGDFNGRTCNAPAGREALAALTDRLDSGIDEIDIHVAAIPIVNAVTLPGGQIIVFEGLIANAKSPDEVAGVLAHEIGHVENRDVVESLLRQLGLSVLLGGFQGNVGQYTNVVLSTAYSRKAEGRADDYAIALLNRDRISPKATADFFGHLGAEEGPAKGAGAVLGYLSSHPVSSVRAARFRAAQQSAAAYRPALSPEQWAALQRICSDDPKVSRKGWPF